MTDRYYLNEHHSSLPVLSREEAYSELLCSLNKILNEYPPAAVRRRGRGPRFHGLYYGPTSISFLFFAVSNLFPELTIDSKPMKHWSRAYLEVSLQYRGLDEPEPSHCGVGNEMLCTFALSAILDRDHSAARELCSYIETVMGSPRSGGSFEWLYGLSGYLYLLRLCKKCLPQSAVFLDSAIQRVTAHILNHPQPWNIWHHKEYLGAVHGIIGIITQLVLSTPTRRLCARLSSILSESLRTQLRSGNYPSSRGSSLRDELVQFCHGSPGFLISLHSLAPYFPELRDQIATVVENGTRCVIERGVLRKSPCLCHGVYGNALSLPYNDMCKFLKLTCEDVIWWAEEQDDSDKRFGLYTGEGGRAWVMALAAMGLHGIVLGYNDI